MRGWYQLSLPIFCFLIPFTTSSSSCDYLKRTPFSVGTLPTAPTYDSKLSICTSPKPTCCTRKVEQEMLEVAAKEVKFSVDDRIIVLKFTFDSNYHLFEKYFRNAISTSNAQLHAMFTRTYGPFYESHTQIFNDFFANLQQFHSTGRQTSLKPILDNFFFVLFRTMFVILNPLEKVTKEDEECMRSSMFSLQPFGDVPAKMTIQLQRSMGTAKVFATALRSISQILEDILKNKLSKECKRVLARMSQCSQCVESTVNANVCENYCLNALKGCLADYAEIDEPWKRLLERLMRLADRLKGPYNVGSVLIPIAVQISESIMVLQEKGPIISAKVIQRCLQRGNKEFKRETMPSTTVNPLENATLPPLPDFSEQSAKIHAQMVRAFNDKLNAVMDFWRALPASYCSGNDWISNSTEMCWNGTDVGRYERSLAGDGIRNRALNPEFSDNQTLKGSFTSEMLKLTLLGNKLSEVYEGKMFSNWSFNEGSGTVSGFYSPIDDEYGDEDGSGLEEDLAVAAERADYSQPEVGRPQGTVLPPVATIPPNVDAASTIFSAHIAFLFFSCLIRLHF